MFVSLESLTNPCKKTQNVVRRKVKINASFDKVSGQQWSETVHQKDTNDAWRIGFDWRNASAVKIHLIERGDGCSRKLKCNVLISPPCLVNDCYYSDRFDTKIKPGKVIACSINPPSSSATLLVISVCITYYESLSDSCEAILLKTRSKKLMGHSKSKQATDTAEQ